MKGEDSPVCLALPLAISEATVIHSEDRVCRGRPTGAIRVGGAGAEEGRGGPGEPDEVSGSGGLLHGFSGGNIFLNRVSLGCLDAHPQRL